MSARSVGVPAEVTTTLREDLGVFVREICTLQQGQQTSTAET
jgi:hypothetical protein